MVVFLPVVTEPTIKACVLYTLYVLLPFLRLILGIDVENQRHLFRNKMSELG